MSDLNDFIDELELTGEVKELEKIKEMREKWEYTRLKKSVIRELETLLDNIKNEKYKDVESRIIFSPAGDGYGLDNYTFKSCSNTSWMNDSQNIYPSEGDLATDILKLAEYKKSRTKGEE